MPARTKPALKKTRIAVFDIDGTIFRSSLLIELFNELVRRGIFPHRAKAEVERDYVAWLDRKGHYNNYLMKLVSVFYRNIAGCSTRAIDIAVREVVKWQKDRVYRYPRHLFGELRKKGYFILIISNSPEPVVRRFASAMGFDAAIGHHLQIEDGAYTGRSIVEGKLMPGYAFMNKIAELETFIVQNKMKVDHRQSVMIGDSEGDVPLLSYVGRPIAFNPSLHLARLARKKGWKIVVERKDAVYDIRKADFVALPDQKPRVPYGHQKK